MKICKYETQRNCAAFKQYSETHKVNNTATVLSQQEDKLLAGKL